MIFNPRGTSPRPSKSSMKLSIVTITLNAARDLPITIESIAGQEFRDFEYVIVDGQSWDSSHEVFRRYSKEIDRIVEIEDAGVYSAMNFALSQCRGQYILFMNAGDTFYSAQALSNVFSFLGEDEPDVIFGDHVYVDKGLELHKRSIDFAITRKALLQGDVSHKWHDRFPCHQATITKRELLERLGGYDIRYEICADHDFLLRAFDAGATMKYVDETIAHYVGGGMSAQRGERCGMEWIQVYRSRSRRPRKIDRLFSADRLVRFDTQSSTTGAKISGFFPVEGPMPEADRDFMYCWCAGDGFSVISPITGESISLFLEGENELADQRLTFTSNGKTLSEVDVPVGYFRIETAFEQPLAPQTIVEILPAKSTLLPEEDPRFVSVLLRRFSFEVVDRLEVEPLPLRREQVFGLRFADTVEPLLRGGWSSLEPAHLWSIGRASHLLLATPPTAKELQLKLSGNPFVADKERKVSISVNGHQLAEGLQLTTSPKVYKLKIDANTWRSNQGNLVSLIPGETAQPPEDPRELGVCLHSIQVC